MGCKHEMVGERWGKKLVIPFCVLWYLSSCEWKNEAHTVWQGMEWNVQGVSHSHRYREQSLICPVLAIYHVLNGRLLNLWYRKIFRGGISDESRFWVTMPREYWRGWITEVYLRIKAKKGQVEHGPLGPEWLDIGNHEESGNGINKGVKK